MSKILNLDELVIERKVTFGGRERGVNAMSVEQFIAADGIETQIAEATTMPKKVAIIVDQISGFVSDTTRDELLKLSVVQLFALLAFIRGDDAEGNPSAEGNVPAPAAVEATPSSS